MTRRAISTFLERGWTRDLEGREERKERKQGLVGAWPGLSGRPCRDSPLIPPENEDGHQRPADHCAAPAETGLTGTATTSQPPFLPFLSVSLARRSSRELGRRTSRDGLHGEDGRNDGQGRTGREDKGRQPVAGCRGRPRAGLAGSGKWRQMHRTPGQAFMCACVQAASLVVPDNQAASRPAWSLFFCSGSRAAGGCDTPSSFWQIAPVLWPRDDAAARRGGWAGRSGGQLAMVG